MGAPRRTLSDSHVGLAPFPRVNYSFAFACMLTLFTSSVAVWSFSLGIPGPLLYFRTRLIAIVVYILCWLTSDGEEGIELTYYLTHCSELIKTKAASMMTPVTPPHLLKALLAFRKQDTPGKAKRKRQQRRRIKGRLYQPRLVGNNAWYNPDIVEPTYCQVIDRRGPQWSARCESHQE